MATTDLLLYITAAVYPILCVLERMFPARRQPVIRGWPLIGAAFFVLYAVVAVFLPPALPAAWFESSLLPGAALGVVGGTIVGHLTATLVGYGYHRAAHRVPLLWRLFHQVHHAPNRLDATGAAIFHPTEMALFTVLGLVVSGPLLGLDPIAASIVGLLGVFNAVFQHSNLRTPRAIGWWVQRPEAHSIHHASDVHAFNYSDFPLWDRLFGTYREGVGFRPQVGFESAERARWPAMACLRDVHATALEAPARGDRAGATTRGAPRRAGHPGRAS